MTIYLIMKDSINLNTGTLTREPTKTAFENLEDAVNTVNRWTKHGQMKETQEVFFVKAIDLQGKEVQ